MATIDMIGIVGAGTMGAGIAQTAAASGFSVRLIDATEAFVERGLNRIRLDLDAGVARGRVTAEQRDEIVARITGGTDYGLLAECHLVIEAVPETLAIKEPVLTGVSEVVSSDCVIATNTSSISITTLAGYVSNPQRFIGLHFFNPVPRMALVEIVTGNDTAAEVASQVLQVVERMGKTAVHAADKPGFIVNRVLIPMINEAVRALDDNVASAADIDTAMKLGAGHPMGPLALADLIGIDVVLAIMRVLEQELGASYAPASGLIAMVDAGTLGRKTGRGFFTYEEVRS
ncbi:MAG: 3-hydroxyacyl-CoA dehydrogenase NAD-binding domain-containing protein [Thermomicrobiales bacterium]|nr:3-hydroxyacyl-CoA dehydrogenase NAD-binding domain-containing protein [Thermomicrobiales bacterium]